jgi:hypothetical protein
MCDQVEIGDAVRTPNALKQGRERVATRQGARAVNPLFFPRSDLCAAKKCRTSQSSPFLQAEAFRIRRVSFHDMELVPKA